MAFEGAGMLKLDGCQTGRKVADNKLARWSKKEEEVIVAIVSIVTGALCGIGIASSRPGGWGFRRQADVVSLIPPE
jgi:hypothetical protein